MHEENGMLKRRVRLVLLVFFILIACYCVYFFVQLQNVESVVLASVESRMATTAEHLHHSLSDIADDVLRQADELGGPVDEDAGRDGLYLMRPDGQLPALGTTLGLGIAPAVDEQGYAVTVSAEPAGQDVSVVLVTHPIGYRENYVVKFYTQDAFARELDRSFPFPAQYRGLFNEWGAPYGEVTALAPEADGGTISAVREGAMRYSELRDGAGIQKVDALHYNVFYAMPQPEGWFIGARVYYEEYAQVMNALTTGLVFFLAGMGVMLALDLGLSRYAARHTRPDGSKWRDALTGLLTAPALESEATAFFRHTSMSGYSLVALDIVAFHRFNTMFGHAAGDGLLKAIGRCIQQHGDCGTHLSSDVFLFLSKDKYPLSEIVTVMLNEAVRGELGAQYVQVLEYKMGVYPLLHDKLNFRAAYDGALMALKAAKAAPERSEVVYDSNMQRESEQNRNIEMNMLHALSREEFVVYIQPKFSTRTMECVGGEALIRWQSEQMGFLMPLDFVPLFEQNGFIVEADFYVLEQIFRYLQNLADTGGRLVPIAVNQSRVTVTFPNYLERVEKLAARFSVAREYIEIEITESALTDDEAQMKRLIDSLQHMGFTVAIDDFGTGYSSLNTLHALPVNNLKIDKRFLDETDASQRGHFIVRNVISMARGLGMGTVCEGVETGVQLDFLKDAGCDTVQGYLMARPMPLAEFYRRYFTQGYSRQDGERGAT